MGDFATLYQNLNGSMIPMPSPSPIPITKTKTHTSNETVKVIKQLIISQIDERKKEFSAMDNAMANKLDKLLQEINSRNVMLFNNLKQINDAQSQHIIQQNELNYAKKLKAHECVLKNHLQTIAEKIGTFNKTQTAMQQTMKQQQPKMQQTDDKSGNFQQIISQ